MTTQTTQTQTSQTDWKLWVRFSVFMVVMIVLTFATYWYFSLQTYHLAMVRPGVLYRDGNRDLREFKHALNFTGARTVVSLIDDKEVADPAKPQFLAETNYCTNNGIQYIRIPVKLGGWPTGEDIRMFLSVVNNPLNQPVLLHCAQGVRRTGMFVAAYQESMLHHSPQQAKDEILTFGHKAGDVADISRFIDLYLPVATTLPATMPSDGKE